MIKQILLLILFFTPLFSFGQMGAATRLLQKQDSTTAEEVREADSLLAGVQHRLDSLQMQLITLNVRLDSLQRLGEEIKQLNDSLQVLLQKGQALEQSLLKDQQLLSAKLTKYKEAQQQLSQLGVGLSAPDVQPGILAEDGLLKKVIPDNVQLPASEQPSLANKAALPLPDFPERHLPKIDSSSFSGKNIDNKIEEQLLKQKDVASLQKQAGNNPLKDFTAPDAKGLAQEQSSALAPDKLSDPATAREAVDHFADHQDVLNKAKGDLSKYKGRFDKIKSVKELSNNPLRRHPLTDVKWYKRIQPGLQWQLGSGSSFRADLGPRASYLLTDKLALGATAQVRTSIGKAVPGGVSFSSDKVWGYSFFASYELKKNFYGQLSFERLNTQKIILPGQQELPTERLWVEGLRLGVGRRFTLYKHLKGYSLIEYNFSPSIHTPYRRQLQAKLGIMWDKRGR